MLSLPALSYDSFVLKWFHWCWHFCTLCYQLYGSSTCCKWPLLHDAERRTPWLRDDTVFKNASLLSAHQHTAHCEHLQSAWWCTVCVWLHTVWCLVTLGCDWAVCHCSVMML